MSVPPAACPARSGVLLTCVLLVFSPGCVVPLPENQLLWGQGVIARPATAFLTEGETTREEALLRFGSPGVVLASGNVLVYGWGTSGWAVVAGSFGGAIPRSHYLALEFDQGGRLRRYQRFQDEVLWPPDKAQALILQWIAGDGSERPTDTIDPLPDVREGLVAASSDDAGSTGVQVGEFRDARPPPYSGTRLGEAWAHSFGSAEIHTSRPVAELVRACVAQQFGMKGWLPAGSGDGRTVTGVVEAFRAHGKTIKLQVALEARSPHREPEVLLRRYEARGNSFFFGPVDLVDAVRGTLLDLQARVAADRNLKRHLAPRDARLGGWNHDDELQVLP